MATVSLAERRGLMDVVLTTHGEDVYAAAAVMKVIGNIPGVSLANWMTILRERAAIYAPFTASGLSITWWADEVQRIASLG